jgi:hypothetical protein
VRTLLVAYRALYRHPLPAYQPKYAYQLKYLTTAITSDQEGLISSLPTNLNVLTN